MLALVVPFTNVSGATKSAEETVKETTQEVLSRIEQDHDRLLLYPEYIEVIVTELIVPNFDFSTMSQLSLDKHWNTLNEEEKTCFTDGFRNLLITRYADIFLSYSDQEITYEPAKNIGTQNYVSVRQIISHTGIGPFYVDYPMRPEQDGWKVVDIIVDGVSLLKSYHATFSSNIRNQGLQEFLKEFNECN